MSMTTPRIFGVLVTGISFSIITNSGLYKTSPDHVVKMVAVDLPVDRVRLLSVSHSSTRVRYRYISLDSSTMGPEVVIVMSSVYVTTSIFSGGMGRKLVYILHRWGKGRLLERLLVPLVFSISCDRTGCTWSVPVGNPPFNGSRSFGLSQVFTHHLMVDCVKGSRRVSGTSRVQSHVFGIFKPLSILSLTPLWAVVVERFLLKPCSWLASSTFFFSKKGSERFTVSFAIGDSRAICPNFLFAVGLFWVSTTEWSSRPSSFAEWRRS